MGAERTYIPAPSPSWLATFHGWDGTELRPLIGWLMGKTHADPLCLEGGRVVSVSDWHRAEAWLGIDGLTAQNRLEEWGASIEESFDAAVDRAEIEMSARLSNAGRLPIPEADHVMGAAAERLIAVGLAEWDSQCTSLLPKS